VIDGNRLQRSLALDNDLSNTLTGDIQLRCQIALARPSGRGGVIKNLPPQEILKNLLLGDPIGTTPDDRDLFRDEIDAGDGIRGFFLRGFFNGLDCFGWVDLSIGQTVPQLFDEFPKFAPGFVAHSGQPIDLAERKADQIGNLHKIQAVQRIQQPGAQAKQHKLCADRHVIGNLRSKFFLVLGLGPVDCNKELVPCTQHSCGIVESIPIIALQCLLEKRHESFPQIGVEKFGPDRDLILY
jgi:hypothetical protein